MFARNLFLAVSFAGLVTSCGELLNKKDDDKDYKNGGTTDVKNLTFKMTSSKSKDIVKVEDVKKGEYKIAEIVTSYEGKDDHKFISLFKHTMRNLGNPKSGDPVVRAVDWKKVDTAKVVLYPYVEINLPLSVVANKGLEFKDNRRYWNQNVSDGDWEWVIKGATSSEGDQFHLLFQTGTEEKGFYVAKQPEGVESSVERSAVIEQTDENTIVITVSRIQDDLEILYRLTYKK